MTAEAPRIRHRPSFATVDLGRIRDNFLRMRELIAPGALVCPMVKANAYGHGDVEVSQALRASGATHLGVMMIEEGLHLRRSGDREPILVFGGFLEPEGAEVLVAADLTTVVCDWSQLLMLETVAKRLGRSAIPVHLEFDTGMNRLGFRSQESVRLRQWFNEHPRLALKGVATHFLRGDDLGLHGGDSERQMQAFSRVLEAFRGLEIGVHVLNSGAMVAACRRSLANSGLATPTEFNQFGPLGSRPGIAIYGAQPTSEPSLQLPIKPALRWESRLVMVSQIAKGETVSYNGTWRAERDSWLGVVPVGYADGYRRALSNLGSVLCRGRRVPVAGVVCMDYFMIDLTDLISATGPIEPDEEVVLIGEQGGEEITAYEIAESIGTISYEVFTSIGSRIPRVYIGQKPVGSEGA